MSNFTLKYVLNHCFINIIYYYNFKCSVLFKVNIFYIFKMLNVLQLQHHYKCVIANI